MYCDLLGVDYAIGPGTLGLAWYNGFLALAYVWVIVLLYVDESDLAFDLKEIYYEVGYLFGSCGDLGYSHSW